MWILCKVVNANWNWLPSPLRNVVPHVVGLVFLSRVVAKENCGYFFFFCLVMAMRTMLCLILWFFHTYQANQ